MRTSTGFSETMLPAVDIHHRLAEIDLDSRWSTSARCSAAASASRPCCRRGRCPPSARIPSCPAFRTCRAGPAVRSRSDWRRPGRPRARSPRRAAHRLVKPAMRGGCMVILVPETTRLPKSTGSAVSMRNGSNGPPPGRMRCAPRMATGIASAQDAHAAAVAHRLAEQARAVATACHRIAVHASVDGRRDGQTVNPEFNSGPLSPLDGISQAPRPF